MNPGDLGRARQGQGFQRWFHEASVFRLENPPPDRWGIAELPESEIDRGRMRSSTPVPGKRRGYVYWGMGVVPSRLETILPRPGRL